MQVLIKMYINSYIDTAYIVTIVNIQMEHFNLYMHVALF